MTMPLRRLHKHIFAAHQGLRDPPANAAVADETPPTSAPSSPNAAPATRASRSDVHPPSAITNSMQGLANAAVSKHVLPGPATIRSVPSFDGSESSHESGKHSGGFSAGSLTSKASGLSVVASSPLERTPSPAALSVKLRSDRHNHTINDTTTTTTTTTTATTTATTTTTTTASSTTSSAPSSTTIAATAITLAPALMNDHTVRRVSAGFRTAEPNPHPHHLTHPQPPDLAASTVSDTEQDGQWDSTIGKAGLGKTGRVINKLVSDNDALKRELQIERLRAEEAKQAAKLVEDKMERMVSDYEGRLLEANVTKTLLARKERQVETLLAAVEAEKKKTAAAQDLERGWRAEMGRARAEAQAQVDEATGYAQLMEGRYNAISSHWRGQGEEVDRAVAAMRGEIRAIVEARRGDDDRIHTLRDLCDQQDLNLRELRRERDDMARLFDEYRRTQEDDLRGIRTSARQREEEQERLLEESRQALDKLKWALNVEKNVKLS